jgi:hypothetical protein
MRRVMQGDWIRDKRERVAREERERKLLEAAAKGEIDTVRKLLGVAPSRKGTT